MGGPHGGGEVGKGHELRIASVPVRFPLGKKPFPTQLALMAKMLSALRQGENALLESPTGTGKALAMLCGVMSWQQYDNAEAWKRFNAEVAEIEAQMRNSEDAELGGDQQSVPSKVRKSGEGACSCARTTTPIKLEISPTKQSKYFGVKSEPSNNVGVENGDLEDMDDEDDMDDFDTLDGHKVATQKATPQKRRKAEGDPSQVDENCPVHGRRARQRHQIATESLPESMRINVGSIDEFITATARAKPKQPKRTRIYFASRTHSQLAQLASELRQCPEALTQGSSMTILGSRNQYCVNGKITRARRFASAAARNEECRRLLSANGPGCIYNKPNVAMRLRAALHETVWDIEDLVQAGKRVRCCPYFGSREMSETADLVFTPYNYLFDPLVREAMCIDLKQAVLVIDEAHNIADVCRSAASSELTLARLELVRDELEHLSLHGPLEVQASFKLLGAMTSKLCVWAEGQAKPAHMEPAVLTGTQALMQLEMECSLDAAALATFQGIFNEIIKADKEANKSGDTEDDPEGESEGDDGLLPPLSRSLLESFFNVLTFMFGEEQRYAEDYRVVFKYNHDKQVEICFWCMNAAAAFDPVAKQCRSVILASGTLAPLKSFASELGTPFKFTLEAPHVIDVRKQLFTGVLSGACAPGSSSGNANQLVKLEGTFANKSKLEYQDALGVALARLLEEVPDGALCFFPSYSFMRTCVERWRKTPTWRRFLSCKSQVFIESSAAQRADEDDGNSSNSGGFDEQIEKFRKMIDQGGGALFFGVFRGKLSEGINFSDKAARAVFICGIPFPNARDLGIRLKKEYQDKQQRSIIQSHVPNPATALSTYVLTGQDWYEQQAYRALNQALGRVIRHKNDFGAVLFLDARFEKPSVQRNLPKWMRGTVQPQMPIDYTAQTLRDFYTHQEQQAGNSSSARPPLKDMTTAGSASNLALNSSKDVSKGQLKNSLSDSGHGSVNKGKISSSKIQHYFQPQASSRTATTTSSFPASSNDTALTSTTKVDAATTVTACSISPLSTGVPLLPSSVTPTTNTHYESENTVETNISQISDNSDTKGSISSNKSFVNSLAQELIAKIADIPNADQVQVLDEVVDALKAHRSNFC